MNQAVGTFTPVSALDADTRGAFIWRVYGHVALAIIGFALIESWLFSSGRAEDILNMMSGAPWLLILGAFLIVGWLGSHAAHTVESKPLQYVALTGVVIAWSIIFVPMLAYAMQTPGVIDSAAGVTLLGTAGLTAVAFITRKDFSFLRGILMWGGMLAIVAIIAGTFISGFELGMWFSVAMIGFAGAAVLYDTSNILHHYPEDRYVGAALQLFTSIALMFWYILRLFMSRN